LRGVESPGFVTRHESRDPELRSSVARIGESAPTGVLAEILLASDRLEAVVGGDRDRVQAVQRLPLQRRSRRLARRPVTTAPGTEAGVPPADRLGAASSGRSGSPASALTNYSSRGYAGRTPPAITGPNSAASTAPTTADRYTHRLQELRLSKPRVRNQTSHSSCRPWVLRRYASADPPTQSISSLHDRRVRYVTARRGPNVFLMIRVTIALSPGLTNHSRWYVSEMAI
jgi:hypothetical protein